MYEPARPNARERRVDLFDSLRGPIVAARPHRLDVANRGGAGAQKLPHLIDRGNGKALLISLWETERDLCALEASHTSTRAHITAESGIESPPAEIFEVALQAP